MNQPKFSLAETVRFANGRTAVILDAQYNPVQDQWMYMTDVGGWFLESDLFLSGVPTPNDGIIRLTVPIVVVYDGPEELYRLNVGVGIGLYLHDFYLETCGLDIRPVVSGHTQSLWNLASYVNQVQLDWRFRFGGRPFTVLLRYDAARVGLGYLGQAFEPEGGADFRGGLCIVAVDQQHPEWAAAHEMGHLFGLDHQDGTFMRAALETGEHVVTSAQRDKVRETALKFGG